jgi:hypothetical protein
MTSPPASHFGRIEFTGQELERDGAESIQLLRWIPDRRVVRRVPTGFVLPLTVARINGVRHLRPVADVELFLKQAFVGGHALLAALGYLDQGHRQTYRLMSLLLNWSNSKRRTHARIIGRKMDLGGGSVLPLGLTIPSPKGAKPVTADMLLTLGESLIEELGHPSQDFGQSSQSIDRIVDHGLLAVACQSPGTEKIPLDDAERMLRIALFGVDQGAPLRDPGRFARVEENLIDLVHGHLTDDDAAFEKWLGDLSGICRSLSRRTELSDVTREEVRYVLFDLLLRAHAYVSQCVEVQMRYICNLVRPPLEIAEFRDVTLWYGRQNWLASCAPVVLHSRFAMLSATITMLKRHPDRPHWWQAFLQAVQWKSQIVSARRDIERQKKSSQKQGLQYLDFDDLEVDPDDRKREKRKDPRRGKPKDQSR